MSNDPLREIERKACADPCFTDAEKTTIREVIRVYRGWQFVFKLLKAFTVVVGAFAGIATAAKSVMGFL